MLKLIINLLCGYVILMFSMLNLTWFWLQSYGDNHNEFIFMKESFYIVSKFIQFIRDARMNWIFKCKIV